MGEEEEEEEEFVFVDDDDDDEFGGGAVEGREGFGGEVEGGEYGGGECFSFFFLLPFSFLLKSKGKRVGILADMRLFSY